MKCGILPHAQMVSRMLCLFKDVTEYGKLVVGDVFLETTLVETIIGLRRTDS